MNAAPRAARNLLLRGMVLFWIAGAAGCGSGDSKPAGPPAKVTTVAHEDQLNTVQLAGAAEKRLGIQTAAVQIGKVTLKRSYGGEVTLRVGASIIVSAPVGGTLQSPPQGAPRVGSVVRQNQPMFHLLPLLSPERAVLTPAERIRFAEARNLLNQQRIDADGQVQQAKVQLEAAQIALDRATRLVREQAGTLRAVDEAKAQVSLAEKQLAAAETRKAAVDAIKLDEDPGTLAPLVIVCPQNGIIRAQQAAVGEVVSGGAPLFEVIDCDQLWIKVPVYAGELAEIDVHAPAEITGISDKAQDEKFAARPITAPPTANPLASTVDVYYEIDNRGGRFRPGERVTVHLPLANDAENRVIPWSAVVHDYHGGTWIYENPAPQTYVRKRVEVHQVIESWAVLGSGPEAGTKVVTAGAMELFGTEFGFAK